MLTFQHAKKPLIFFTRLKHYKLKIFFGVIDLKYNFWNTMNIILFVYTYYVKVSINNVQNTIFCKGCNDKHFHSFEVS
jgi:hypothetical protein